MSAARLGHRLRQVLRTSWRTAAWAIAIGLLLQVLFPVSVPFLPALAAAGFAVICVLFLVWGEWSERGPSSLSDSEEHSLRRAELLERWSTPAQFGYAFGSGALLLAGLGVGLGLGILVGF